MKKLFIFIFLFTAIFQISQANDTVFSKVIIYRDRNYYASAVDFKIYANNNLVVRLKNNSYYVYSCMPGKYIFNVNNDIKSQITINVEKSKTYYLRFGIRPGFWVANGELLPVDSTFAYPVISDKMNEITVNPLLPYFRPKNRLGINMNIGGGFYSTTIFTTTSGDESKISCGGGYGIGIKYGYELNKYIDLAADFNYQFSILSPYLSNASTTFRRAYISLTPSFIIPIKGGENMRFKIGYGYDYYMDANLIIGGKNLQNGYNDTWKYDNASGYHASINFEMNTGEKWSLSYGLKYYKVIYDFKSSSLMHPLSGNSLLKPDGSGLDFLMGISYHF